MISEYTIVQTEYADAQCIKAALKELGYVFEEHKIAQQLYGYEGRLRQQQANIIIRKQHVGQAANDVGFIKKANGCYELIISQFDSRKGSKSAANLLNKLKQIYSKQVVLKKMKQKGFTVTSIKTNKDGRLKIKVLA